MSRERLSYPVHVEKKSTNGNGANPLLLIESMLLARSDVNTPYERRVYESFEEAQADILWQTWKWEKNNPQVSQQSNDNRSTLEPAA